MKKLLLVLTVVLLGSAAAWAQSKTQPKLGVKYQYGIDVTADGTASTVYTIYSAGVSGIAADLLTSKKEVDISASGFSDFTVDETVGAAKKTWTVAGDTPKLNITWNASSAGKIYYIVAKTTQTGGNNCADNMRGWMVKPGAAGMLAITNVQYEDPTSKGVCATDVNTIKFAADGTFTVDYSGTKDFVLKITSKGCSTGASEGWEPTVVVKNSDGSALTTLTATVVYSKASNFATTGTVFTDNVIYAKVTLTNPANNEAAGSSNAKSLLVTIDGDDKLYGNDVSNTAANITTDPTTAPAKYASEDDTIEQTYKSRPKIAIN